MLVLTCTVGRPVRIGAKTFTLETIGRYGTVTFTYGGRHHTVSQEEPTEVEPDSGTITYLDRTKCSMSRARFGFDFPRHVQIARDERGEA